MFDGNRVGDMVMNPSYAYIKNAYGLLRIDLLNREFEYLFDIYESGIIKDINLNVASIDSNGDLYAIINQSIIRINVDGSIEEIGSAPIEPVEVLKHDRDGVLWVGLDLKTDNPIAKYNGTDWEYIDVGYQDITIKGLTFNHNNHLVFTTGSHAYISDGVNFTEVDGLDFYEITAANDGKLATSDISPSPNVNFYDNDDWRKYHGYTKVAFDHDDLLWAEKKNSAIYTIEHNNGDPNFIIDGPIINDTGESMALKGLGFDLHGNLWIGKENGIFILEEGDLNWTPFTISPFQAFDIRDLEVEKDSIWIETTSDKLYKIIDFAFDDVQLIKEGVHGIQYDEFRNGLWIKSNDSIMLVQNSDVNFTINDNLNFDFVTQLIFDPIVTDTSGNVWINSTTGVGHLNREGIWHLYKYGHSMDDEIPASLWYNRRTGITPDLSNNSAIVFLLKFELKDQTVWDEARVFRISESDIIEYEGVEPISQFANDILAMPDSSIVFSTSSKVQIYKNNELHEFTGEQWGYHDIFIYDDNRFLICGRKTMHIMDTDGNLNAIPINNIPRINGLGYRSDFNSKKQFISSNSALLLFDDLTFIDDLNFIEDTTITEILVEEKTGSNLSLYPVPSEEFLNIKFSSEIGDSFSKLSIRNSDGLLINTFQNEIPASIDISNYPPGVYFVNLVLQNNDTEVFKFIKK